MGGAVWRGRVAILLASLSLLWGSRTRAAPPDIHWKELSRTAVDEPILALAFLSEGRLLALARGAISLWRVGNGGIRREARETWAVTSGPVRHAGGLIVGRPGERAAWVLSSHEARARLVRVDGARLALGDEADAAPWPNAPEGLRFRPGTNLLDGLVVGGAPLTVVSADSASFAVVLEDGALYVDSGATGVRVGGAIASLWHGTLLASAPLPPSEEDALLVLGSEGGAWRAVQRIGVRGTVAAVTARGGVGVAEAVVAVVTGGRCELLHLELRLAP